MLLQLQNWGHSWVQVGIMRVTWSTTLGGCYGQTDYPHASDSEGPWVVNVHSRTVCPNGFEVPEIWVRDRTL